MKIRALRAEDVEALLLVQDASPESAAWSRESLERAVSGEDALGWASEAGGGTVCGFLLARETAGEMEILNLAVLPAARRQRAGSLLLEAALAWGSSRGAAKCFLEVRKSNAAARAFYSRHGFREAGTRPHYYEEPREAALLMARSLG